MRTDAWLCAWSVRRLTRSIRKRQFQPRDFEKVGLVGKGSMASVYLVRMKGTEKLYAMKVLRKKDYPTKRAVQRAIAERYVCLHAQVWCFCGNNTGLTGLSRFDV